MVLLQPFSSELLATIVRISRYFAFASKYERQEKLITNTDPRRYTIIQDVIQHGQSAAEKVTILAIKYQFNYPDDLCKSPISPYSSDGLESGVSATSPAHFSVSAII